MSLKTYTLPASLDQEIAHLEEYVEKFKKGEVSLTEFKVQRVPFGVYEQRKKDTYMMRVRCAGSIVTPQQLEKIAALSKIHAAGYIHLTTRQEIQLHYVLIDSIVPVIRELKTVGLATRGGGGNTIRNIMAQEDAGIAPDEAFDVSAYAIALTSRMVAEADSWNLPRKFKINFSGSSDDRGYATIADVGYIAQIQNGRRGFKVYVAGGLGAKSQAGNLLFDFVEETQVYNITKAVKNLFYKYGNRKNKHAARLRFLWQTLGEAEFKKKFFEEYEAVQKNGYPPLDIQEIDNSGIDPSLPVEKAADAVDFDLWKKRFVRPQRQKGLCSIILPVHLGHVDNDNAIALAQFLKPFGDNTLRIRKDQNFLIRGIPEKYLPNFYNFLKKTFDNFNRPFIIDKMISCAGASTCQLGICLSPGAATAAKRQLEKADFNLDGVQDAVVNISGCPNSCGQHNIADLGFFGKVSRREDKVFPSYNVVCGGRIGGGQTQLAHKVGEIASRDLPRVVQDIFKNYLDNKSGSLSFKEYMQSEKGAEALKQICAKYQDIPSYEKNKRYYFDWETDKIFSVAERGKGECSAGIFDLIESDFGHIQQAQKLLEELAEKGGSPAQKPQLLKDIVFYCARVLLVSRALEPRSEQEAYNYFREYFINTGLVDTSLDALLKIAESGNYQSFLEESAQVYALAERMKYLYDIMDSAFQFKLPSGEVATGAIVAASPKEKVPLTQPASAGCCPPQKGAEAAKSFTAASAAGIQPQVVKDFRGVGCPMNFVKTKMELSRMKPREILEIWIDDGAPIENVPGSVREEGHKVLGQKKINGFWSVLIEKS